MKRFDAIVAGAGIWGCTAARRLAEAGKSVLVLEKRAAAGGNCRCEIDSETGIEVHTFGSHIFHTSNEEVWAFVNRFTGFNDYRHCVLARTRKTGRGMTVAENVGRIRTAVRTHDSQFLYHLPIGKTLLEEFFGVPMQDRNLDAFLDESLDHSSSLGSKSRANRRQAIFDAFIRGYTSKQWGVPPEEVDPSVISRLRVRNNYSTDYFDDPHQGIPRDGYNALFERMLDHPNIRLETEVTLRMEDATLRADRNPGSTQPPFELSLASAHSEPLPVYYSGPIDALFNYRFGALPWRTLNFRLETLDTSDFQGSAVVNYTDADVPFTRIHEFRHYHPEWEARLKASARAHTVIMREYSAAWKPGDEPYYPIDNADSRARLARYQEEVDRFNVSSRIAPRVSLVLGGRLGQYKYFDMDKSVEAALTLKTDLTCT